MNNSPKWKVVSYYTPDYEVNALSLKASLEKQMVPHDITPLPPFKNWLVGVAHKCRFMLEQMDKHQCPLVWLDADAVVNSYPSLFDRLVENNVDIGVHFRNDKRYRNELLSGTIFVNYSLRARVLLQKWIDIQTQDSSVWDQRTLQEALERTEDLSVYRLPASYTQIFDSMKDRGVPVIEHFQASRGKDKTAQVVNMVR